MFDVDDTAEVTYGWEVDNDFGFDPVKQQEAIDKGTFVANEPVLELANRAAQHGVKVYLLTGATILANFGDQFSDLEGGYAEFPVKLPNPTYYLP